MGDGMNGEARRIRGVIFDLDGTLYTMGMQALRLTRRMWRDAFSLRHLMPARRALRGRRFESAEAHWEAFFNELGRRQGRSPERARRWYHERFMPAFIALIRHEAARRPGVRALLGTLKERGVRLAVLSDFDRVEARLEALAVQVSLFDDIHCSQDFGALKPSATPVDVLAARWGCDAEAIAVVGDRDDMDGETARLSGAVPLILESRRDRGPHAEIYSWSDVVATLKLRTSVELE